MMSDTLGDSLLATTIFRTCNFFQIVLRTCEQFLTLRARPPIPPIVIRRAARPGKTRTIVSNTQFSRFTT